MIRQIESVADHHEDEWLFSQFPEEYRGFAADVGAGDGVSASNTWALEQFGWKVLCVEPNPHFIGVQKRQNFVSCACGSVDGEHQPFTIFTADNGNEMSVSSLRPSKEVYESWGQSKPGSIVWVPVRTLDRLLEEAGFEKLDVLSIDTEGTELDVLKGANLERWRPKAIVTEMWASTTQDILTFLEQAGYTKIEQRGVNALFLAKEAMDGHNPT